MTEVQESPQFRLCRGMAPLLATGMTSHCLLCQHRGWKPLRATCRLGQENCLLILHHFISALNDNGLYVVLAYTDKVILAPCVAGPLLPQRARLCRRLGQHQVLSLPKVRGALQSTPQGVKASIRQQRLKSWRTPDLLQQVDTTHQTSRLVYACCNDDHTHCTQHDGLSMAWNL